LSGAVCTLSSAPPESPAPVAEAIRPSVGPQSRRLYNCHARAFLGAFPGRL